MLIIWKNSRPSICNTQEVSSLESSLQISWRGNLLEILLLDLAVPISRNTVDEYDTAIQLLVSCEPVFGEISNICLGHGGSWLDRNVCSRELRLLDAVLHADDGTICNTWVQEEYALDLGRRYLKSPDLDEFLTIVSQSLLAWCLSRFTFFRSTMNHFLVLASQYAMSPVWKYPSSSQSRRLASLFL